MLYFTDWTGGIRKQISGLAQNICIGPIATWPIGMAQGSFWNRFRQQKTQSSRIMMVFQFEINKINHLKTERLAMASPLVWSRRLDAKWCKAQALAKVRYSNSSPRVLSSAATTILVLVGDHQTTWPFSSSGSPKKRGKNEGEHEKRWRTLVPRHMACGADPPYTSNEMLKHQSLTNTPLGFSCFFHIPKPKKHGEPFPHVHWVWLSHGLRLRAWNRVLGKRIQKGEFHVQNISNWVSKLVARKKTTELNWKSSLSTKTLFPSI